MSPASRGTRAERRASRQIGQRFPHQTRQRMTDHAGEERPAVAPPAPPGAGPESRTSLSTGTRSSRRARRLPRGNRPQGTGGGRRDGGGQLGSQPLAQLVQRLFPDRVPSAGTDVVAPDCSRAARRDIRRSAQLQPGVRHPPDGVDVAAPGLLAVGAAGERAGTREGQLLQQDQRPAAQPARQPAMMWRRRPPPGRQSRSAAPPPPSECCPGPSVRNPSASALLASASTVAASRAWTTAAVGAPRL